MTSATGAAGWRQYYCVESPEDWVFSFDVDQALADKLGLPVETLVRAKIGLHWSEVDLPSFYSYGFDPATIDIRHFAPDDVYLRRTWFACGDPWTVLLGVSETDVLVGTPSLFEGGMAGPPKVTLESTIELVDLPELDPAVLASAITTADKATRGRLWRCPLCREQRYGKGCRCNGPALGINYD